MDSVYDNRVRILRAAMRLMPIRDMKEAQRWEAATSWLRTADRYLGVGEAPEPTPYNSNTNATTFSSIYNSWETVGGSRQWQKLLYDEVRNQLQQKDNTASDDDVLAGLDEASKAWYPHPQNPAPETNANEELQLRLQELENMREKTTEMEEELRKERKRIAMLRQTEELQTIIGNQKSVEYQESMERLQQTVAASMSKAAKLEEEIASMHAAYNMERAKCEEVMAELSSAQQKILMFEQAMEQMTTNHAEAKKVFEELQEKRDRVRRMDVRVQILTDKTLRLKNKQVGIIDLIESAKISNGARIDSLRNALEQIQQEMATLQEERDQVLRERASETREITTLFQDLHGALLQVTQKYAEATEELTAANDAIQALQNELIATKASADNNTEELRKKIAKMEGMMKNETEHRLELQTKVTILEAAKNTLASIVPGGQSSAEIIAIFDECNNDAVDAMKFIEMAIAAMWLLYRYAVRVTYTMERMANSYASLLGRYTALLPTEDSSSAVTVPEEISREDLMEEARDMIATFKSSSMNEEHMKEMEKKGNALMKRLRNRRKLRETSGRRAKSQRATAEEEDEEEKDAEEDEDSQPLLLTMKEPVNKATKKQKK